MRIKCPHCDNLLSITIAKESLEDKGEKEDGNFKFSHNPLDDLKYTQKFGSWPEYYKKWDMDGHNGVDFKTISDDNPEGKRNVYAVMDGVITIANREEDGGYGRWVRIKHDDGGETTYGHLHSLSIEVGQRVGAGDIIGISDNTGSGTGPHLHFGYRPPNFNWHNGYKGSVNPESYFI